MYLIIYVSCLVVLSGSYGLPSVFDFRADYTYSEKTNNYYKLHENDVTWKEAVTTCWSEGAQLFYPEDEVETTEVDALINPWYKHIYVWIGVSNLNTQHVYKTIDGRLLNEVHNESNVIDSNDDNCLLMWNGNLKYQLWVNKCNEKISFMCKYPPGSEQESFEYPTAPDQLETTETSTSVIETTTPIITHLGGDNAPMEAQDDQYRIPVQFGNLVGEELRKFSHDEQHDIMISILEVLRDYEAKTLTRIAEQSLPGEYYQ